MRPFPTTPAIDGQSVLPGADFADAFARDLDESIDAPEAARRAFSGMPIWVRVVLALRNGLMAPFGLKTSGDSDRPHLGMFPVVSSTPARVVLGFDDRHLNFRIVVDVRDADAGRRVTITTLVARHNLFGRAYLAAVMPFHKIIVPTSLAQVAR